MLRRQSQGFFLMAQFCNTYSSYVALTQGMASREGGEESAFLTRISYPTQVKIAVKTWQFGFELGLAAQIQLQALF